MIFQGDTADITSSYSGRSGASGSAILKNEMTKVQHEYDLLRKIDDDDAEAIGNVYSYYGIQKIHIAPSLDHITVDYDATRLSPADLTNVLIRYGIPITA